MSSPRPPIEVRRWRWRPLILAVPVTVLFVVLVVSDRGTAAELDRARQREGTVVGEVVESGPGAQAVRWYDDVHDRVVQVESQGMPVGDVVAVVPDHDDPVASDLEHGMAGDPVQTLVYLVWFVPPWVWLISRWRTVRRSQRLIAAPVPTFALWATVVSRSWSTALVRIDATDAGGVAEPLCHVQVIDAPDLGPGRTPVEVKGNPRPAGRLVLRSDESIIWPTGRTRLRASFGRRWRTASVGRQAVVVGAVVAAAALLVVVLEVVGVRDNEARRTRGRKVEAEVVAVVDEVEWHLVYELPDRSGVWAGVVHYPWDALERRVGETVLLSVDPDDPMRPVTADGSYHHDPALFGGLAVVVLAVAGGVLLGWGAVSDSRDDDACGLSPPVGPPPL